ncbi:AAA family ATPase [Aestuariirhabdus sp. Z084]|uniref:ATP-dependent nuclease n=1 Tax=Aestuariirhabdus haliotis TaxID=2918751 RepID=UPI00201B4245|nr:AAA family ATPase [Aestuariirhabdus haliotis]MCL6414815.1 AAA family ATPase [Aestuariirhabdus haliotis]MCL6418747.1 AAA family ATPase [Aestuariirhabdus haliotis]
MGIHPKKRIVDLHLKSLKVSNFRKLKNAEFKFVPGLNVIVGANNIGKTALVDALRSLLAGHEEQYPRFTSDDIHRPCDGTPANGDILFQFVFSDLSDEDEADFLPSLVPVEGEEAFEAHISVSYSLVDRATGRMRPKRWCGEHEEIGLNSDILENLRGVYLKPLRDASQGLKPGRNSQLAKLLRLLGDEDPAGKEEIEKTLVQYDEQLKEKGPIESTQTSIASKHSAMLGDKLAQLLSLGISGTDFNRLSARLSLQADYFDIELNGLGFNNLIFMAVVLSEMAKDPTAAYRGLIVEEPEAHLHPQLQSVLLDYLQEVKAEEGEGAVQVFVTSHSPNFASLANLDSTVCLIDTKNEVEAFFPRDILFDETPKKHKKTKQKLERYLDVTRAEIFFARRVIFVEGAAELMLLSVLVKKLDKEYDLRRNAISLLSVEGLNFDAFLPLFGKNALQIPVAVITDGDPYEVLEEPGMEKPKRIPIYPDLKDNVNFSDNTRNLLSREDELVKVFHGLKTLEYDLALYEENRKVMLSALKEMHPKIGDQLEKQVLAAPTNQAAAKTLFCGMFERGENEKNIQKGRYGQVLAQAISEVEIGFKVPSYIEGAIKHVCQ